MGLLVIAVSVFYGLIFLSVLISQTCPKFDNQLVQRFLNFTSYCAYRYFIELLSFLIIAILVVVESQEIFGLNKGTLILQLIVAGIILPITYRFIQNIGRTRRLIKELLFKAGALGHNQSYENWFNIIELCSHPMFYRRKFKLGYLAFTQLDLRFINLDGQDLFTTNSSVYNYKFLRNSPNGFQHIVTQVSYDPQGVGFSDEEYADRFKVTDLNFVECDFSQIKLRNIQFENCNFDDCQFSQIDFLNVAFVNCKRSVEPIDPTDSRLRACPPDTSEFLYREYNQMQNVCDMLLLCYSYLITN